MPERTGPRFSWMAFLGWLAFSAALAYIVLVGGSYAGVGFVALRVVSLSMMVVGLSLWAVLALRRPEWWPRTAVWPALLAPFVVVVISTLTSLYPRLGLDYVAWNALLIALYLLLVRVAATEFARKNIGAVLAFLGLIVSGVYIVLIVGHWLEWWDLIGRLSAPMLRPAYTRMLIGGPTIVAPVMILLWIGALAGVGFGTPRRRVTGGLLTVTTFTAVLLSGTRGAWLGLAVGLAVTGFVLLVLFRGRLRGFVADRRVRVGIVVAVGVGALAALAMAPALLDRLTRTSDGGRAYYIDTALRMFETSPLVGIGPGNWAARRIAFTEVGEPDIYVAHPHNIYMGTLAETGLLGAGAGVVALVAVLWLIVSALRSGSSGRQRWGLAGAFVLAYLAVALLVDSFANLPVVVALALLPIAFLDAASPVGITDRWTAVAEMHRKRVHASVTVFVFLGALLSVLALVRIESAALDHQRAVAAINDHAWVDALEPASSAAAADPEMVPYQVTHGIAAFVAGDMETAAEVFERAATVDDLPQSWMNLAEIRLRSDAPPGEVVDAIERGLRVGEQHASVALAGAELYARSGDEAEAVAVLARLLVAQPSLAADDSWQAHSSLSGLYAPALAQALDVADDPWELLLMSGDEQRARELAVAAGDEFRVAIGDAWAGDPTALAWLQTAATDAPSDQLRTTWAARASAKADDPQAATRFRRLAMFQSEGTGSFGLEMRVGVSGADTIPGATETQHIYGENGYRRVTPGELLVPGLPIVVPVDLAEPDQTTP